MAQKFFYHGQLSYHLTIPISVVCNFAQQESPTTSIHSISAFTIVAFLGFLQIQTVGNEPSSIEFISKSNSNKIFMQGDDDMMLIDCT